MESTHKATDRRRHGLGDNTRHAHAEKFQVKQASRAAVTPSSAFASGAGAQATKISAPKILRMKAGV